MYFFKKNVNLDNDNVISVRPNLNTILKFVAKGKHIVECFKQQQIKNYFHTTAISFLFHRIYKIIQNGM